MKRQRFLARQRAGQAFPHQGGDGAGAGGRPRPDPQQPEAFGGGQPPRSGAPGSPLSQLVARGYPATAQEPVTAHHPYGDRPSSGSAGWAPQHPSSGGRAGGGNHGAAPFGVGGFDANVGAQWNANVQRDREQRQNRLDPSVAGPHVHQGGQRVTQAPGGGACIDISWSAGSGTAGPGSGGGGGTGGPPPRLPGPGSSGGGTGNYGHGRQPQEHVGGSGGGRSTAASPAGAHGGGGNFAAPWGRDDDVQPHQGSRQTLVRREAPFGSDAAGPTPAGAQQRHSSRGRAPSPSGCRGSAVAASGANFGGAEACRFGARGAARPPGGSSQVVLG